jgi:hypothetical protein
MCFEPPGGLAGGNDGKGVSTGATGKLWLCGQKIALQLPVRVGSRFGGVTADSDGYS